MTQDNIMDYLKNGNNRNLEILILNISVVQNVDILYILGFGLQEHTMPTFLSGNWVNQNTADPWTQLKILDQISSEHKLKIRWIGCLAPSGSRC